MDTSLPQCNAESKKKKKNSIVTDSKKLPSDGAGWLAVLSQYKKRIKALRGMKCLTPAFNRGAALRAEQYPVWHNTLITPGFVFRKRESALVWEPSRRLNSQWHILRLWLYCSMSNKADCLWCFFWGGILTVSLKRSEAEFHKRQVLLWLVILWWSEEGGPIIRWHAMTATLLLVNPPLITRWSVVKQLRMPSLWPDACFLAVPKGGSVCLLVPSQPQAGTWGMVVSGVWHLGSTGVCPG